MTDQSFIYVIILDLQLSAETNKPESLQVIS